MFPSVGMIGFVATETERSNNASIAEHPTAWTVWTGLASSENSANEGADTCPIKLATRRATSQPKVENPDSLPDPRQSRPNLRKVQKEASRTIERRPRRPAERAARPECSSGHRGRQLSVPALIELVDVHSRRSKTKILRNVLIAAAFPVEVAGRVKRTRWRWRTSGFFRFLLLANAMAVELPTHPACDRRSQ